MACVFLLSSECVALFGLAAAHTQSYAAYISSWSHACPAVSRPMFSHVFLFFLQSWPVSRLSSEGVALFGLAAAPAGGMYRDVLVKFFLPNRALPFHSFSQVGICQHAAVTLTGRRGSNSTTYCARHKHHRIKALHVLSSASDAACCACLWNASLHCMHAVHIASCRPTFTISAVSHHPPLQGDIVLVSRGDPLEDSHESVVVDFSSS
jgi:hypothetical protein